MSLFVAPGHSETLPNHIFTTTTTFFNPLNPKVSHFVSYWKGSEIRWFFFIAVSSLDTSSSFEDQFKELTSLITFFEQCSQGTQGFIDLMRQDLSESIKADLITDAEKQRLSSYSAKKSTLLVVGQTNSGKSSFVNELLGGSFMPTSEVPCTSRIVRLKYSEENYYQVQLTEFLKQSAVAAWNFFIPFLGTPRGPFLESPDN